MAVRDRIKAFEKIIVDETDHAAVAPAPAPVTARGPSKIPLAGIGSNSSHGSEEALLSPKSRPSAQTYKYF